MIKNSSNEVTAINLGIKFVVSVGNEQLITVMSGPGGIS